MVEVASSIDLPMKLQCPYLNTESPVPGGCSILGSGDIVVPGLFLGFLHNFDRSNQLNSQYLSVGWGCYVAALVVCGYFLIVYQVAQPVLLYVVPFMLVPVSLYAK